MSNSFKDPEHLKMLCDSQYKTIIEQSKRIQELELELKTLKDNTQKKQDFKGNDIQIQNKDVGDIIKLPSSEQETICKLQLLHLRNQAISRELTLEEARKVEIYSKILSSLNRKNNAEDAEFKKLSDNDLLKELENDAEG